MASDVHVLREVFRGLELMLVVLVGAILLWLKPPHPARTILGIAWVMGAPLLFIDFTLPNEALNTAMHLGLDELLILSGLPIILFLRWFPTPAPWRSPQGIAYAASASGTTKSGPSAQLHRQRPREGPGHRRVLALRRRVPRRAFRQVATQIAAVPARFGDSLSPASSPDAQVWTLGALAAALIFPGKRSAPPMGPAGGYQEGPWEVVNS